MIRIEPASREWADALAEGDDVFSHRFGIPVAPGWSGFPEALSLMLDATASRESGEWGPHLFFDEDGTLVGNGGWKGAPVDGVAELGYAVAPSRQGRGIATAAVQQLLQRGRAANLRTAVAHTLPQRSASTTVLERCGFTLVGVVLDPSEGRVWRWELIEVGQTTGG
ncbi:MAG: GNAT family N-acetyltransferase [Candidatus Dormibacteraeota bacterium]|nr:GNAT family N-acetyltransferase [Candidatus Dormibacteraeota bacterium]